MKHSAGVGATRGTALLVALLLLVSVGGPVAAADGHATGAAVTSSEEPDVATIAGILDLDGWYVHDPELPILADLFLYDESRPGDYHRDSGFVGPDGTFSFDGLVQGATYVVWFSDLSNQFFRGYYTGGGTGLSEELGKASRIEAPTLDVVVSPVQQVPISGTVVLPEEFEYTERDAPQISAEAWSERYGRWMGVRSTQVDEGGSFTIPSLARGVDYRLRLIDNTQRLYSGYFGGPDQPMVQWQAQGALVRAPESDVRFDTTVAAEISGQVVLPGDFVYDRKRPINIQVQVRSQDDSSWIAFPLELVIAESGGFAVKGLFPGAKYLVRFVDREGRVESGYYLGPGYPLVDHEPWAAPIVAPSVRMRIDMGGQETAPLAFVNTVRPTISGVPALGEVLRATPGVWTGREPYFHYEWLRDGVTIGYADRVPSYTLRAEDVGARISVRVHAFGSLHVPGDALTVQTERVRPGSIVATKPPSISGRLTVGSVLQVQPGTWSHPQIGLEYRWLRDGKAIPGATQRSYTVRAADRAKRLSVEVIAAAFGYATKTVSTQHTRKVAKGTPTVRVKLPKTALKPSMKAKAVVVVSNPGVSRPTGTVRLTFGKKSLTRPLAAKSVGKATFRLPKLKKGRYTIRAQYRPSKASAAALVSKSSAKVTLKVR